MKNVHEIRLRCTNAQKDLEKVFIPIKKMLANLGIVEEIASFIQEKNILTIQLKNGDDFSFFDADALRDKIDAEDSFSVVSYTYITGKSNIPCIVPIFSLEFSAD